MLSLFALNLASVPTADAKPMPKYAPLEATLGDDKSQKLRLILWTQFWARLQQHNPGTTINGEPTDLSANIGIRRARVLLFGRPNKRMLIMTHFGINNQTFNNQRKPQVYIHDAWIEGEIAEDALTLGLGLHYFNGVSRQANYSTMAFLMVDGPIFPWTTIERTDQFARQMGVYAKGKLSRFDYRVAVNQPFQPLVSVPDDGTTEYRDTTNTWAVAGYAKVEFADSESNVLPFLPGTYLGTKTVVNLGAGVYWHPEAMGRIVDGTEETFDQTAVGVDVFVDTPVGDGSITAYALYQYNNYGEDYIRNVGIMNVGAGGTSLNGGGNAYPLQGTGHTAFAEAGYLLPSEIGQTRLQPYVGSQLSFFDALGEPMFLFEAGANWYLAGQNAKITAHWRNRPVFGPAGQAVTARRNEGIVQVAFRY